MTIFCHPEAFMPKDPRHKDCGFTGTMRHSMIIKEKGMSQEMMQDVKKSVFRKLKSRKGETISETLVALLISSLALTMLAGAITASANLVEKSRTKMCSYYAASEQGNGVIKMSGAGTEGTVTITDSASGGLDAQTYTIVYYKNEEFTRYPVYSYKPEPGD